MKIGFSFVMLFAFASVAGNAQSNLYVRGSLQLATDAEVYLTAFQPGVGIGKIWPSGWGMLAEYYRFSDTWDDTTPDCPAEGFLKQQTITLMATHHFRGLKQKSFYLMAGVAYQVRKSEYLNLFGQHENNKNFMTGTFEFGHRWRVKKSPYGIAASIKCTGPFSYNEIITINDSDFSNGTQVFESSVTEILTQLSIGLVVDRIFIKPAKRTKSIVDANKL